MKILMVAEKPAIAQAIADAMNPHGHSTRKGTTPVHEFTANFRGQQAFFKVTSVIGHVYATDFPPNFGWNVDPKILFDAPVEKIEANDKAHVPRHLKNEAAGCDALILWLDCDREGENICFEVIDTVKHKLNRPHQILRAKFSAVTKQDIDRAMNNLVAPNKNEALAVDARQELDLKVGVAFTRYQTGYFHYKYGNLDSNLISYGPCQIPTLGFCVDRYDQIQSFKPEPFWTVQPVVDRAGQRIKLSWERQRILKNKPLADTYLEKVRDVKWATLVSATTSKKSKPRPTPLNTVDLLKICSKSMGLSPHKTMQTAERLYICGYISYPRTESTSYPAGFDFYDALKPHRSHPQWGDIVRALLDEGAMTQPKKGFDAGDHPPITPTRPAQEGELTGTDWRIYDYITRHFIATVSPDCVIQKHSYVFDIAGEKFTYKGKGALIDGYTAVMPWLRIPQEKFGSEMKQGDQFAVCEVTLQEGRTSPPDFLTEWELISLMEKNGIGTDASIPVHIENICTRNYVSVDQHSRTLKPTNLGIALVHGYTRIDPELYLPKVRASIENAINQIALGKAKFEDVIKNSLNTFKNKFEYFVANINLMDELFEASFSKLTDMEVNTRMKPKCGACNRYMKYINLKPHRLYCSTCEQVYSLPKNGSIKMSGTEFTCPLDGFELVVHADPRGKYIYLCPKCFNAPTYPGMTANKTCVECPNVACAHNGVNFIVEPCPACDFGQLTFDYVNGLRMDCSVCKYAVHLPKNCNKMTVASKHSCEKCKAKLIHFKYNEKNAPLEDKKQLEFDACYRCHPVIKTLIEIKGISGSGGGRYRGRRGENAAPAAPQVPPPRSEKPKPADPVPNAPFVSNAPTASAPNAMSASAAPFEPPAYQHQQQQPQHGRGKNNKRQSNNNNNSERGPKQQKQQHVPKQAVDSQPTTAAPAPAAEQPQHANNQQQQRQKQPKHQQQQQPQHQNKIAGTVDSQPPQNQNAGQQRQKQPRQQQQRQQQQNQQPAAPVEQQVGPAEAAHVAAPQQRQQPQERPKQRKQQNPRQNRQQQQQQVSPAEAQQHIGEPAPQQQQQQRPPKQPKPPKQPRQPNYQHKAQSSPAAPVEEHTTVPAAAAASAPELNWKPKQQPQQQQWKPKENAPAPAPVAPTGPVDDQDEDQYYEEYDDSSATPQHQGNNNSRGDRGGRGGRGGRGRRGGGGRGGRGGRGGATYVPVNNS